MIDILNDAEIQQYTKVLQQNARNRKYVISDVVLNKDGNHYQFVDLVLQGGGVLGISLIGFIYGLEKANIRFLSIGGTSVGGIVSLLLAAAGDHLEEKSDTLLKFIDDMDMKSFIDGKRSSKKLCLMMADEKKLKNKFLLVYRILNTIITLFKKHGLNPGENFTIWLSQCLSDLEIKNNLTLKDLVNTLPNGLKHRIDGSSLDNIKAELNIVASDITTETKVIFPKMAPLYWDNADKVNPALFARASMSIPLFFQPLKVNNLHNIDDRAKRWDKLAGYNGVIPNSVSFLDGGLLSNFPIDLFYKPGIPIAPTVGVKLGSKSRKSHVTSNIFEYAEAIFKSMSHYADFSFISNNPEYKELISYIDTRGHNWLNFYMTDLEKMELFKKGLSSAFDFLEKFDWRKYKQLRASMNNNTIE